MDGKITIALRFLEFYPAFLSPRSITQNGGTLLPKRVYLSQPADECEWDEGWDAHPQQTAGSIAVTLRDSSVSPRLFGCSVVRLFGCSMVVLIGFTCQAITFGTVILNMKKITRRVPG